MTEEQKNTCRISSEAVSLLDSLMKHEGMEHLSKRLQSRADDLADEVLHRHDLSDKDREQCRLIRLGILEALKLPSEEREAHVRVLAKHGLQPGDGIEYGL